jgi:hypothetical protein
MIVAIASATSSNPIANAAVAPPRDRTLVLVGKVVSITQGGSRPKRWVVTIEVEKVVRGEYSGSRFSFAVHSPSRSGLEEGHSYEVKAVWKGEGYDVDENQWRRHRVHGHRRLDLSR